MTVDPFASPTTFAAIPRLGGLILSPAGDRLVAAVSELDDDGGTFVSSLWSLDPQGQAPARRLTRSSQGESDAAFLPDGSLLFTSTRPDPKPASSSEKPDVAALWLLPAGGGDPWVVASRSGGITGIATGRDSSTCVVTALSAPGSVTDDEDKEWWSTRRKHKVSAILHDSLPIRHWDHHLGPSEVHVFAGTFDPTDPDASLVLRDLTPDAGPALHDSHPVLSTDGSTVVVDWMVRLAAGPLTTNVVAIDVATGQRRTLAGTEDGSFMYTSPAISPDGTQVVAVREARSTESKPWVIDLWLIDVATGEGRPLNVGDRPWVNRATFNADGTAVLVETDLGGHAPLWGIDLATGEGHQLTGAGAWASPVPHPDGHSAFALHSTIDEPPRPVRFELATDAAAVADSAAWTVIDAPGAVAPPPRPPEEVTATAADGTPLRAWLVLPEDASPEKPAPLVLWVHGGPVSSWNGWSWRWNPRLMAANGWAILLPDPALSTGYGDSMVQRGWNQWGGSPFDDLMAITDVALTRPDLDPTRTAAMGGSYGGYMANWIAGHTERFKAIVSHASIWSLEQFVGTTDWPELWADEWGWPEANPESYRAWSPDASVDAISTPMLLIHGERDYRCPVGESVRLWTDLTRRAVDARFLWFGDENHWILQPGDSVVWYETVLAFLDQHVLGEPWRQPASL